MAADATKRMSMAMADARSGRRMMPPGSLKATNRLCTFCGGAYEWQPEWVYMIRASNDSRRYFCTWRCLQLFRKLPPEEQREVLKATRPPQPAKTRDNQTNKDV